MQSRLFLTILFCGFLSSAYCQQPAAPQGGTDEWPGQQADGSVLLPNLWSLRPAGKQVLLGDFPVNVAINLVFLIEVVHGQTRAYARILMDKSGSVRAGY